MPRRKVVYFMSLDNVKFRKPVKPGDQIRFEVEVIQIRGKICKTRGVGEGRWRSRRRGRHGGDGSRQMKTQRSIHPTAIVSPRRELGTRVEVGPFAIIGDGCEVGDDCVIAPRATLERDVKLAAGVKVGIGSVLGGTPQDLKYAGEHTTVEIGDGTVIREYVDDQPRNVAVVQDDASAATAC